MRNIQKIFFTLFFITIIFLGDQCVCQATEEQANITVEYVTRDIINKNGEVIENKTVTKGKKEKRRKYYV